MRMSLTKNHSIRTLGLLLCAASFALLTSCGEEKSNKPKKKDSTSAQKKAKNLPLFQLMASNETGVNFINSFSPDKELEFYDFQYQFNGGGVGIGDFNNDGLNDIFFSGNEVENKLYLNEGNLKFKDISESAGIALPNAWCNGVSLVDLNNDGLLDIYLSVGGYKTSSEKANVLLINNGNLTFTDKASDFGIADTGWTTQSLFLDFDNDNDLDLFVLNHPNSWQGPTRLTRENYKSAKVGADHFYINEGGSFVEATKKVGLKEEILGGYGLGVSAGDLDQNGYMDLYISNDYDSPDYLYMNQGNGTFKEEVKERTKHIALYSMGNDIADYNNDGLLDIIAVDMSAEDHVRLKTQMGAMAPDKFYEMVQFGLPHQYMYNTLQLNNGNGTFSDVAMFAGVSSTDWSWAPLFADFDNDGYKDLLVTNGYRLDDWDNDFLRQKARKYGQKPVEDEITRREIFDNTPSTPLTNYVYRNNGDYTFSKKSYEWGLSQKTFTQGAAFADLDNDGDLDLIMNNMENEASIYKNQADVKGNGFVRVLIDENDGIASGAIVTLEGKSGKQTQQFQPCRGYMSSVERHLHFGIGEGSNNLTGTVKWKDGSISNFTAKANSVVKVNKSSAKSGSSQANLATVFDSESPNMGINFVHEENEFDDFKKEILLPHRNSMHGPPIAKGDLNGDGLEDVFIGGAHGHKGAIYFQNSNGSYSLYYAPSISSDKLKEDLGALIYDYDNDGDQDLYVVSGGNEFATGHDLYQDRLYENDGSGKFTRTKDVLPSTNISGKSVAAGDMDNDGDLDLFIGGRLVPGTYPFAPRSMVLRYHNGKYTDVTQDIAPDLMEPGLVTNSAWVDIDNDDDLDLIVIGEWMPLMILENDNDKLTWLKNDLAELVGWWSGLEAKDYDNDGDIDFLLGNLGMNYKYKASKNEPFQIWCHDFDESGSLDIVLGYYDHGTCYPVRGRTCSSQQMPFIAQKFRTFNEFANATISDVYGEKLDKALNLQANTFQSIYIENLGNKQFKYSYLPAEAQFSMITSIQSIAPSKDGKARVVLAGNLHTAEVETPRADAGIGVLMELDNGEWKAKRYSETGLFVDGDVKGMVSIKNKKQEEYLIISKNNDKAQVVKILE